LLGQLLWSAQGITGEQGYRATPSAGAIFPLTVLLVDPDGVYEYTPEKHALRRVLAGDIRSRLQAASLDQSCVGSAPANLVIAMQVAPMAAKYGAQAERYCLLEAGHAAQNVLLQATGLGLVAVPVAAFQEEEVAALLDLPRNLVPVYMLPLGWPA
jgi:SagB-type dehydrogenase family enzyme